MVPTHQLVCAARLVTIPNLSNPASSNSIPWILALVLIPTFQDFPVTTTTLIVSMAVHLPFDETRLDTILHSTLRRGPSLRLCRVTLDTTATFLR